MKKEQKYIIKFINAKNEDGTVWYTIQVFSPKDDESWTFRQRYSHMRDIHERCLATSQKNDLPEFPHKKLFGNTNEAFIQRRKKELENYYNTVLGSKDVEEMPELLEFFNTNKPAKKKDTKPSPVDKEKESKNEKNKQIQLKKKLDDIARRTEERLVECEDFNNNIEDQSRTQYNKEFQKIKLELRSPLLGDYGSDLKIKGCKDIEDYWAFQITDNYEDSFKRLDSLSTQITDLEKNNSETHSTEQKTETPFVVAL